MYMIYTDIAFADKSKPSPDKEKVECDSHGSGYATYIREHLLAQPCQKWFSHAPTDEDPWPDAWCTVCETLFQEHGERNRINEKKANIKVICHCCYEKLRNTAHREFSKVSLNSKPTSYFLCVLRVLCV